MCWWDHKFSDASKCSDIDDIIFRCLTFINHACICGQKNIVIKYNYDPTLA